MTIHHDLDVVVEAEDIYNLLRAPFSGATECIYCMIAAAARSKIEGSARHPARPFPYEVLEGEGGEWGDYGWTHYMRMEINGREQIVLIKIPHDAAIATGDLEDRRIDELRSALKLLKHMDERVMLTPHDCSTWAHQIWSEGPDGSVTWRADSFADLPDLLRICGERGAHLLAEARNGQQAGSNA